MTVFVFLQNGRQGMSQQHISQFLQTCSNSHTHTHTHTHTHVRALKRSGTPHLYIWVHKRVPPPRCLAQNVMLCSIQEQIGLFSPQEGRGRAKSRRRNRNDHSHFLTELTISLPRSEIGGSEKHTIRNHYSAPNCC